MTIACLPWYQFPETEGAQDVFWTGLVGHLRRQGLRHLPGRLTRGVSVQALLADPRLIFGQCCGYDLMPRSVVLFAPFSDLPVSLRRVQRTGKCVSDKRTFRGIHKFCPQTLS